MDRRQTYVKNWNWFIVDGNSTSEIRDKRRCRCPLISTETLNLSIDDLIFIAAPTRATSQVLLGEVDITLRSDSEGDVTTEESFPKKCIVDGNAYSHSQTVTIK